MALFETTFPPYVPFGSRNLSLTSPQMRGTDVAVFQAVYNLMLKTMNPASGPIGSPVALDGIFGSASRQAAINIQAYFGLSTDGIVGPNTFFVFGQGNTYGGPRFGSRTLQQGMSGGDVTVLQNRLNLYRYASILGAPADGVFGSRTDGAAFAFKQDAIANGQTGLTSNGVVGNGTFDALWLYTGAGGRGILPGRNGFDVVMIQVLLARLGYYSGIFTGFYDAATIAAVRAFQTARGIGVDGEVGPVTFHQFGILNPFAAPQPLALAWPTAPQPQVSTCSIGLTSQTGDLHPYGVASLVINGAEGFESVDVVGNLLPDPSTFGSQYGAYAFQLTSATGAVLAQILMSVLPTAGDWAGSYSPGVYSIQKGLVQVLPTPAGSATGPYGSVVLQGNLAMCQ